MTAPRRIVAGTSYRLTGRCIGRQYLLNPSKRTNAIFDYCLARAAAKHGMLVSAYKAMSTHYHAVITDPRGVAPEFYRDFHATLGRALNAEYGRWDSVWSGQGTSLVPLESVDDTIDKIAYVLTNSVAAGAVRKWSEWPGAHSLPDGCLRKPRMVPRSRRFLDATSKDNPDVIPLPISVPPLCTKAGISDVEFAQRVKAAVAKQQTEVVEKLDEKGWKFMRPDRIRAQGRNKRSTSFDKRRERNPQVAAKNVALRVAAIARLRKLRRDYREAYAKRCSGVQAVVFPEGTYKMRLAPGVAPRPPP